MISEKAKNQIQVVQGDITKLDCDCIVNAANEVVVAAFLRDEISFLGMSDVIEKTMEQAAFVANPSYEDYVATDEEARRIASELVRRQNPQK